MTIQDNNSLTISENSDLHLQMISWRHWLHQHPELMFEEFLSSDYIASILESYDIEMHRGLATTGIVATVHGKEHGKEHDEKHGKQKGDAIGLRADMDALPIPELNEFSHKSKHDGKMHACGHDGHSTMLLGAAIYLKEHNDFNGTVHFIFQPAEEGGGGGKIMVEEGLFDLFPCKAVYGMHNWPGLAAGEFAVHDRAVMAAVDKIKIKIKGKGGHAAMPDQLVDPILTGAQVIIALQSIVSRNLSPLESAVISLTMLEAGHASNVMPDELNITGTLRYYYPEDGVRIKKRMEKIVSSTCEAMGATGSVEIIKGYPATINTPKHAQKCANAAALVSSEKAVHRDLPPTMGGEDFSFILNACEGAYIWIGNGEVPPEEAGSACMLHNMKYDFNDEILPLGASYWVQLVQNELA